MGPCPNPAASEPLGHDPLGPELAGVVEHDASLRALQVLSQPHPWPALTQDARQRRLPYLDRLPPKVRAVQLQQVGLVPVAGRLKLRSA